MNFPAKVDPELENRLFGRLLDVFIRAGLILVLAILCYRIFAPFIALMAWAVILAINLYPIQRSLAANLGGRQGLAATLITLAGVALVVVPTAVLVGAMGDSLNATIDAVRNDTLSIPAPKASVADWPLVGKRVYETWAKAHEDLPGFIQSLQPKIGELAKRILGVVAAIGGEVLMFLGSFIVAGIIMAFGESGGRSSQAIFERIVGVERGQEFCELATATIRAVAQGVIGIAFIQAILIGLALLVAGVPFFGPLAVVVLVIGIAQLPALIVTLPAIGYIWSSGEYGTSAAIGYTVLLLVSGMADNVLKPLLLGRGVHAPMPVVLIGALGGMATTGIIGMFVGSTLLALGYQIFMGWVAANPDRPVE
ncbi:AI-2E family transporter [Accumulibacter sp.]|uniref:AI-2E family transporter n=1 Tax=Accumulibacter sp. TaxID=2053492 RepID=UPI0025DECACD|nr:AI-2E family transporter [Accumulibacter sp.]MCM8595391.1 AI-2E family transporter [Accumulibacter sp.]MCM8626428.1 AI-2E family transporter [Accumulibacter sp.]MDS4049538.1 AI-2E family transporter [Accumulibacter sp.]